MYRKIAFPFLISSIKQQGERFFLWFKLKIKNSFFLFSLTRLLKFRQVWSSQVAYSTTKIDRLFGRKVFFEGKVGRSGDEGTGGWSCGRGKAGKKENPRINKIWRSNEKLKDENQSNNFPKPPTFNDSLSSVIIINNATLKRVRLDGGEQYSQAWNIKSIFVWRNFYGKLQAFLFHDKNHRNGRKCDPASPTIWFRSEKGTEISLSRLLIEF